MPANMRPYVANRFFLDLQKTAAGWLLSAEGGLATTEVVNERLAGGNPVRKHAGNVKMEEITFSCGSSMTEPFYEWLKNSLDYKHERKEGSIVTLNYDFKESTRLDFFQALITEIGLPGVDATSKEACKFTIKMAPEWSELKHLGATAAGRAPTDPVKQKRWQAANFRFEVDGMDTKRVSKVDAIVIKQNIVDNTIGERLLFEKEPAQIDFPNVVFYIPEVDAGPWYKWYEEFVVQGKSDPSKEKQGHLDYLTTDVKDTLFTVNFTNLGIIKYTPDKLESSSEKVRSVKIEMYCERMSLEYKSLGKFGG